MENSGTWKLRLAAFAAALVCLALAFAVFTEMPVIFLLVGLAALIGGPVLIFSQGWLGIWLLALAGLWGGSMLLFFANPDGGIGGIGSMREFVLMCLVLAGLTGLGVAVIPPHVAAKHRAAWPFGYLNPHRAAEKAKRERLLLEEEIIYDRIPRRWNDDEYDDEDDEELLPMPKRKSSAR